MKKVLFILLVFIISVPAFAVTSDVSIEGLLDVIGNKQVSGHTTSDALSLRTGAVLKQTTANYTLTWANPGAARTLTIADPGVNDTFTTNAATQTVTNKTMSTNSKWNGNTVEAIYGGTGQTTYTTGEILYASTINTLSKLAAGTSGQSLHTQGAGVIPVWANGGMVSRQIITATGNYVVPYGVTSILVEGVAAGGGAGGCDATSGSVGGGGGAGGYFRVFINNVVSGTAYAVTVGAGGGGTASAAGSPGTANTTFVNGGTTYTAYPGQGGGYLAGVTNTAKTVFGGAGGTVSINADINSGGAPGINGSTGAANANSAAGSGGSGPFGGGGASRTTNGAGNAATGYGAGGGGALRIAGGGAASPGGSGTGGAVFVWEFK